MFTLRAAFFSIAVSSFATLGILPRASAQQADTVAGDEAAASAVASNAKATKAVQKLLAGKWSVASVEFGGESQKPSNGAPDAIEVKDGQAKFFSGGRLIPTMSNVKVTCDPKSKGEMGEMIKVNLARPSKAGRDELLPCLVMVKEGKLQFAMPMVMRKRDPSVPIDRPKSFDTKSGAFIVLTAQKD